MKRTIAIVGRFRMTLEPDYCGEALFALYDDSAAPGGQLIEGASCADPRIAYSIIRHALRYEVRRHYASMR